MKTLKVGMLGAGTVGSQIARLLVDNKADLASRAGAELELVKVAVKNINTNRVGIASSLLTDDAASVVNDPHIDLVIEVMGGISPAKELILAALISILSNPTPALAITLSFGAAAMISAVTFVRLRTTSAVTSLREALSFSGSFHKSSFRIMGKLPSSFWKGVPHTSSEMRIIMRRYTTL